MKLWIAWKRASGLKAQGYKRMVWGELPVRGFGERKGKKSLSYVLLFSYEIFEQLNRLLSILLLFSCSEVIYLASNTAVHQQMENIVQLSCYFLLY